MRSCAYGVGNPHQTICYPQSVCKSCTAPDRAWLLREWYSSGYNVSVSPFGLSLGCTGPTCAVVRKALIVPP